MTKWWQSYRKQARVGMLPLERASDRSWTEQIQYRPGDAQQMKRLLFCDGIGEKGGRGREGAENRNKKRREWERRKERKRGENEKERKGDDGKERRRLGSLDGGQENEIISSWYHPFKYVSMNYGNQHIDANRAVPSMKTAPSQWRCFAPRCLLSIFSSWQQPCTE